MNKVKVYQGCSWFNNSQKKHMEDVYQALKDNKTCDYANSYRPLDNQYKGMDISRNSEFLDNKYQRLAWGNETYTTDISGMDNCNIGVFAWTPNTPDEGQAFEMGWLRAKSKPVLVVVPNGEKDKEMNLMLAYGATQVIELDELKNIDLNSIYHKQYDGGLF